MKYIVIFAIELSLKTKTKTKFKKLKSFNTTQQKTKYMTHNTLKIKVNNNNDVT